MGEINNKEKRLIMGFWTVFCVCMIISIECRNGLLFLFSFCVLGLCTGYFCASWMGDLGSKRDYVLFIISLIVTFFLAFFHPPFNRMLRDNYFKNKIEVFNEPFELSKSKKHRFIFAFDNSGSYLTENKLAKSARVNHLKYCDAIKDYVSKDDNYLYKKGEECNYRHLLKSRLCYDLMNIMNFDNSDNTEFLVLKIGDTQKDFFNATEFEPAIKDKVKDAIGNLCINPETEKIESVSDFKSFYNTISTIITDTEDKYTYTLFIYSDFVHDLNNSKTLEEDTATIHNKQKKIKWNRQNLFIYPVDERELKNKSVEAKILPGETDKIKHFKINKIQILDKIPYEIQKKTKLSLLYSDNTEKPIVASTFLEIKDEKWYFYSEENKYFSIQIGEKQYHWGESTLIDDIIKIVFEKDNPQEEEIEIEISKNGVFYSVTCVAKENILSKWKVLIPIGCFVFGCFVAFVIYRKKINQ
jgi:hypothetical protein